MPASFYYGHIAIRVSFGERRRRKKVNRLSRREWRLINGRTKNAASFRARGVIRNDFVRATNLMEIEIIMRNNKVKLQRALTKSAGRIENNHRNAVETFQIYKKYSMSA